jgi:L-threonylcarbamoyladenylate synthase
MMNNISNGVSYIKHGCIVAFPTETVYGLGADATNDNACRRIFDLKGRQAINPLIVHIATLMSARLIGKFNDDAEKLAAAFWPGPLTIILPMNIKSNIAKSVSAGLKTIALRLPFHHIAHEFLALCECPIAAPSANPSGYISATTFEHVFGHFSQMRDVLILKNNQPTYGIESTIVDCSDKIITILRHGFITKHSIERVLGRTIQHNDDISQIKAPGMMAKHYAPITKVRLNATYLLDNEIGMNFGRNILTGTYCVNLNEDGNIIYAAANLYKMLRDLDNYAINHNNVGIAIAPIPELGIGVAINDRLKRAACRF